MTKRAIGTEFDAWSEGYSDLMDRIVPYYRVLLDELFDRLPDSFQARHILDLGSGNGNVIATAIQHFPKAQITAVDASTEMLDQIQHRFPGRNIHLQHQMMEEVSMEAGSVDLVTASFSMHHLDSMQKETVIQAAQHALRPGGYFLYSDLMVAEGSKEHHELLVKWKEFVLSNSDLKEWEWLIEHHLSYDRVESELQLVEKFQSAGFTYCQSHRHEAYWVAMTIQR